MNAARGGWWIGLAACVACVAPARGQVVPPEPQIGYVYPAGGKQGTTFRVIVAGQFLRGASDAYVSGAGVRAKVLESYAPLGGLDREERAALAERIFAVVSKRWDALAAAGEVEGAAPRAALADLGPLRKAAKAEKSKAKKPQSEKAGAEKDKAEKDPAVKTPEHALLYDLENQSLRALLHDVVMLREIVREQANQRQLGANVVVEVTIDREAATGNRELRLLTRAGLTNPVCFQVGGLPEVREQEAPPRVADRLPAEAPLELPVMLNGQIMGGDVDCFRFHAKEGQQLVIVAHARELIPYVADAVPGWFQAVLSLSDAEGRELAFADDYEFNPDPVLRFAVPADGVYALTIRDALYRGRQDFVYRIAIGETPFITGLFPIGCRAGQERFVAIDGWNLPAQRLFLGADDQPGGDVRETALGRGRAVSNTVAYAVDALPAAVEQEPNDTPATAQAIRRLRLIDGRIGVPGDRDVYAFKAEAGEEVVVEIVARRVRSPLDGLVRLLDGEGKVVAWNDDFPHVDGFLHTGSGTLTHEADPYLRTRLPSEGTYFVQVGDAQGRGGDAFAYRLRVGPPAADFALRCTPASVNVRAGLAAPLQVYALRKDGFSGPIEISLVDAPSGAVLSGGRIPAGRDSVRMTLSVNHGKTREPFVLALAGHALIDGRVVTRPVVPAEDRMQAFLYRHLVPADALYVAVLDGRRSGAEPRFDAAGPVQLPLGGRATVQLQMPPNRRANDVALQLREPPPGIRLASVERSTGGFALALHADADATTVGFADNLIVDVIAQTASPDRGGGAKGKTQRTVVGVLPALPVEVVAR